MSSVHSSYPNRRPGLADRNGVVIRRFRSLTRGTVERRAHAFVAASAHEPVFGLFPSPRAAIDELLARAKNHYRGADALLRAIIKRYQRSPEELWPAMLVLSFHHMLCEFALKEARKDGLLFDDVHEIAIISLLEGARSFKRVEEIARLPFLLRLEMQRRTRRALRKNRHSRARDGQVDPFDDENLETGEEVPDPLESLLEVHKLSPEFRARVLAYAESWDGRAPSHRQLVSILRSDLAQDDQERLYQRIKQRRARELASGVHPDSLPPWWRAITDPNEDGRRRR
jgi:hypothetical protein